jgi:hypothetical protein
MINQLMRIIFIEHIQQGEYLFSWIDKIYIYKHENSFFLSEILTFFSQISRSGIVSIKEWYCQYQGVVLSDIKEWYCQISRSGIVRYQGVVLSVSRSGIVRYQGVVLSVSNNCLLILKIIRQFDIKHIIG